MLVTLVVVRWREVRRWRVRSGGVEAGATARQQITYRDQAIISLDHREAADLVGFGESADRG